MLVLAIESIMADSSSLDELIITLRHRYKLLVIEHNVSGKRLIHVNRNNQTYYDSVQNECSSIVIDEDMTIISRNVEKVYSITDNSYPPVYDSKEPVIVEELLPGKQITISRFYSTYLLSTEKDIHGRDQIVPRGPKCNEIVMHVLNSNKTLKGIDGLFAENLPESICWCFQIVPKNEFNIDKFEDYDLVLLNAINIETNREMPIAQLKDIATYRNIRTPVRRLACGMKNVKEITNDLFLHNPSIIGTVITKIESAPIRGCGIQRKRYNINISSPWRSELNRTAQLVLRHQYHGLKIEDKPALINMLKLIREGYESLLEEMDTLYLKHKTARTRKLFANGVNNHPMAAALFALKDKKITHLLQMYKILRPVNLLKYVENRNKITFKIALDAYKEVICQQIVK